MKSSSSQRVLLFAGARAVLGQSEIEVPLATGATANHVFAAIAESYPALAGLLPSCRLAVNQQFVPGNAILPVDAELALIPPVSGG